MCDQLTGWWPCWPLRGWTQVAPLVCSAGKPGTGKSMKIPAFMQIAIYETTYSYMTYHIYIYIIYTYIYIILYFTYPFKSTRNRGLYLHWFYDGNGKFPINGGVNGPIIYKRWFSMFDSRKVCMMSCPSNIGGFAVNNWSRPGCSERQGTEWGMVRSWRSLVFL